MINNQILPSFTIALPSYEAGESLIQTLKGIYRQSCIKSVDKVLVVIDGNLVEESIRVQIEHPKLEIVEFKTRKGQAGRINDIFSLVTSDVVILTNDDVIINSYAVEKMLKAMQAQKADLVGVRVAAIATKNTLQKIIQVGITINEKIGLLWNNGDNYLLCNGRLLGISKRLYKKTTIPELLWNNDAYLYLLTKENSYSFYYENSAIVSFALPTMLSEHMKQSKKFQNSLVDNQRYFKKDISSYYTVPLYAKMGGFFYGFIKNPLWTLLYVGEFLYSRYLAKSGSHKSYNVGYWETDSSTKVLK